MNELALRHPLRVVKALLTNAVAWAAPAFYARWTGETGRGRGAESVEQTARYFERCVDDYRARLALSPAQWRAFLKGRQVLEYGPGDLPGVALLLLGMGAGRVVCVDRFPLVNFGTFNRQVLGRLAASASLTADERRRAGAVLAQLLAGAGADGALHYRTSRDGTLGEPDSIDLLISRAVLEHVGDLDATFADMARVLRADGVAIHQVDLKSHGMHIEHPLDFLCWPSRLWVWMYGCKGAPNRVRLARYRELAARHGLRIDALEVCERASPQEWAAIAHRLPAEVRELGYEDGACLGFWMVLRHATEGAPP
jgi:SAM-dependent methyltransferase